MIEIVEVGKNGQAADVLKACMYPCKCMHALYGYVSLKLRYYNKWGIF